MNKQTNEIKVKSQRESSSTEGKGRRRSKGRGLKQAGAQLRRLVSSLDNLCGILNENSQAKQIRLSWKEEENVKENTLYSIFSIYF